MRVLFCLLTSMLLCGCAPELSQPQAKALDPGAAPVGSDLAHLEPAPEPRTPARAAPPPSAEARPFVASAPAPAPQDVSELLSGRHPVQDLSAWARDGSLSAVQRASALRALAQQHPGHAVDVATQLARAPETDRHTRANAVALLARSEDPGAAEALASLPPRYRALATALRAR